MVLSSDGSKFATASADKSIGVYDAKSGEVLRHITTGHSMGIYDLIWIDSETFVSASADNSAMQFNVATDGA
jgi:WD40 repeat protein